MGLLYMPNEPYAQFALKLHKKPFTQNLSKRGFCYGLTFLAMNEKPYRFLSLVGV